MSKLINISILSVQLHGHIAATFVVYYLLFRSVVISVIDTGPLLGFSYIEVPHLPRIILLALLANDQGRLSRVNVIISGESEVTEAANHQSGVANWQMIISRDASGPSVVGGGGRRIFHVFNVGRELLCAMQYSM